MFKLSQDYINENLKTIDELEKIAETSLNELINRYHDNKKLYNKKNISLITTSEFIRNNYKEKLLFYSMNHPTKYVIQFICEEINKILQIPNTINYDIDLLSRPAPHCILYKCIQKNINFDINKCTPFLNGKTCIKEITQLYFDSYKDRNINF